MNDILVFDAETSIHNKGNPFDPRNFMVSYAYCWNNSINFKYYTDPDFRCAILDALELCNCIIGFNIKFDIHWLNNMGIILPMHVKIWDCQIAEFINSGQRLPYDSLDAACDRYGLPRKPDRIKQYWEAGISTEDIPIRELEEYNIHDVESTKGIYEFQQQLLTEKQKQLVILEGEDLRTLQAAEYAGIKFDVAGAKDLAMEQSNRVSLLKQRLLDYLPSDVNPNWFNFNSGDHLSALLYGGTVTFPFAVETMATYKSGTKKGEQYIKKNWFEREVTFPQRFKPLEGTEVKKTRENPEATTRFYQVDEPTLLQLRSRKTEDRVLLETLREVSNQGKVGQDAQSLIEKITEMNWQDNYLHGQFNQNIARTGRLTSSGPNLQNQSPEIDKLLVSRYDN